VTDIPAGADRWPVADLSTVRRRIRVTGTVQGVGFRPFVFHHASRLGLRGWVRNDSAGVLIEVEGDERALVELSGILAEHPPRLARIGTVTTAEIPVEGDAAFAIVESGAGGTPTAPVGVDTATCPACVAEVDDPADRRHRYPFTNCTDCGPRYTIVRSVPYDRPATTMADFTMCTACQAEYDEPADRRFHAQPNACGDCGPRLRWTAAGGNRGGEGVEGGGEGGEVVVDEGIEGDGALDRRSPPCGPGRWWRSRASAATTWPPTPPTRTQWPSCAVASTETTSPSR
jgi:hydrogenase maturation protein HypF